MAGLTDGTTESDAGAIAVGVGTVALQPKAAKSALATAHAADSDIKRALALEAPGVTLRDGIRLTSVHIVGPQKDGHAYVGYEFACVWDGEHGLGVMTHRGRVVQVGGGDTAFLTWVAKRDLEGPAKSPNPDTSGRHVRKSG